jgi:hypothetical protein
MTRSIPAEQQPATLRTLRQPCKALNPRAFTLEAVEQWALDRTSHLAADCFRLTSFWDAEYVRQHVPGERKTRYMMRLAQAENYGIAFDSTLTRQACDPHLVGEDSRRILKDQRFRDDVDRTALIDLIFGQIAPPSQQVTFDHTLLDKHALRARLFADEAMRVLQQKGVHQIKGTGHHVHIVGATAGIISALLVKGFKVTATDLSSDVVGQNLAGVTVCDGIANCNFIKAADLVILTGMTLANRTLPTLIESARTFNTSTMVWAITARNLGQYYIQHGVDCVISDPSPFLFLPGRARVGIWRREI